MAVEKGKNQIRNLFMGIAKQRKPLPLKKIIYELSGRFENM